MPQPLKKRRILQKHNFEENILQHKFNNKLTVPSENDSRLLSPGKLKKRITRVSNKILKQDENSIPQNENPTSTKNLNANNRVLSFCLQPLKYDMKKNDAVVHKSSVLRDSTNSISNSTNMDPSLNAVIHKPMLNKKFETIVMSSDELTSRSNFGDKNVDNILILQTSVEKEINFSSITEQMTFLENDFDKKDTKLKVQKMSKTAGKNIKVKTNKKFFKYRNTNKISMETGKKIIKETVRKRKTSKKNSIYDSSYSIVIPSPDKMTSSMKKTLRPRQIIKNYCDDSKLLEQLSPKERNSKVVIEKLPDPNAKKLPIWKSVKFHEPECKGKDVYDMSDGDLSIQENKPKKKNKTIRKPVKQLKKTLHSGKSVNRKKPVNSKNIPKTSEQISNKDDVPNSSSQMQSKPKVISVDILDNAKKNILLAPPLMKPPQEFRPFRVTQVFNSKTAIENNMSDHSLLSKSISPIAKMTENVNIATPWRLPSTNSFSCVRNLVQSTPQQKTMDRSNLNLFLKKRSKNKIEEDNLKNVQEKPNEPVSNNDTITMKTNNKNKKNENPRMTTFVESKLQNFFFSDECCEDKENTVPNHQSAQKSLVKNDWVGTIPIFEPQPGTSGLQRQSLHEAKYLKQTNLNNFLSLDDTPERTEIRTPHGIFDDVHSTSIDLNLPKEFCEDNIQNAFGFDNDFDTSPIVSENVNPLISVPKRILCKNGPEYRKTKLKSICRNPVRLSTNKILKSLHQSCKAKEVRNKNNIKLLNNEDNKQVSENGSDKNDQKQHCVHKDNIVTNSFDTFDLQENEEKQKDEQSDEKEPDSLPLFADLESPTHFEFPPKNIYKRKRAVTFSRMSDDVENCKMEKDRRTKKSKKSKKEDKNLNEWAKNINKTFEEIDQYNLIIE